MNLKRLGTMIDCSRNAVMNPGTVRRWIDLTADMGYNMLMLYTEDTYELEGEPYFGYGRGHYSREELKALDSYAAGKGMELIPCIQTLAHLNTVKRWPVYKDCFDIDDILLAEDEEVYRLIDKMFDSVTSCFTSRVVHIGMDEAFRVGRGRFYDKHGDRNRTGILLNHLSRVAEIGRRYGLRLCMWSDMFFRLAGGDYYNPGAELCETVREQIPENVELIYWDYYHKDIGHYRDMLEAHKKLGEEIWFAGGSWTWTGFAPHNAISIRNTKAALTACGEKETANVFLTLWGDNGGECSRFSVLPALFYAAKAAGGNNAENVIRERFAQKYEVSWEDFMLLDLPDSPNGSQEEVINSEKYLLYQDPFCGLLDSTLNGTEGESFARCAARLRAVEKTGQFRCLFETQAALCELLAVKADLGSRTREAYASGDPLLLSGVIALYQSAEERLDVFYDCFERQWEQENKGQGFEVQDIRLGGLRQRLRHCRRQLERYAAGEIGQIDELEEKLLDFQGQDERFGEKAVYLNVWSEMVTPNIL